MRVKIQGVIIEQLYPQKTNYNHEIYSMILTNINTERAKQIHQKKRFKRLFTFSDLYVNKKNIHMYISGEDTLIKDFINCIMFNQIIRVGDKVISITNIEPQENNLKEKDEYIFKTNFIINEKENGKVCLSKDFNYIQSRINQIIKDKYLDVYGVDYDKNISAELIKTKHQYTKYKDHHLNSYKATIKIKGNYELINLLYNLGIGENTASGHGFVWEVC